MEVRTVEETQTLIAELEEKYPPMPPSPWRVSQMFMDKLKDKTLKLDNSMAWNHIGGVELIVDERIHPTSLVPWYEDKGGHLLPVPLR